MAALPQMGSYSIPPVDDASEIEIVVESNPYEYCRIYAGKKSIAELEGKDREACDRVHMERGAMFAAFLPENPSRVNVILIPPDFDPTNIVNQARMAHELTHYVQKYNGFFEILGLDNESQSSKAGARHIAENQAYNIQRMWQATRNDPAFQRTIWNPNQAIVTK